MNPIEVDISKKRRSIKKCFSNRSMIIIRLIRLIKSPVFVVLILSATGIASYILAVGFVSNEDVKNFLLGLSSNLIIAIIIFLLLEQGIKSLDPISEVYKLPEVKIIDGIKSLRRGQRIRLLDTFTSLPNEYLPEFKEALSVALKRGVKVEILLIHPYSVAAKKRAEQLRSRIDLIQGINENLAQFYNLYSDLEDDYKRYMEIRLYTTLPSLAMHRCGDWAYVSLFPVGERSNKCPNLKVPMDNPFGSYIDNLFEEVWHGTVEEPTIPLEAHMRLQVEPTDATLSHIGYHFAYDETGGEIDKRQCFIIGDNSPLYSIYKDKKESQEVCFLVDGKRWHSEPRVLSSKDPQDSDEYNRALMLIGQRYKWNDEKLGRNPVIFHFQNIVELDAC